MTWTIRVRRDIPTFNELAKIEEFMDWLSKVEQVFDCMEVEEHLQVKLVLSSNVLQGQRHGLVGSNSHK